MKLGFSTGALYTFKNNKNDHEAISNIANVSKDVIELSLIDKLDMVLDLSKEEVSQFKFRSLHSPKMDVRYGKNDETYSVFQNIENLHNKYNFHIVVVHPDLVEDFSVLEEATRYIPFVIENMDKNKNFGRTIEELDSIFEKYSLNMLVDLQHTYSMDQEQVFTREIFSRYKDIIQAFHISGEDLNIPCWHAPLFKTKQDVIIENIPDKNLPLIIESPVDSFDELEIEYNYILERS